MQSEETASNIKMRIALGLPKGQVCGWKSESISTDDDSETSACDDAAICLIRPNITRACRKDHISQVFIEKYLCAFAPEFGIMIQVIISSDVSHASSAM
jgi:hypothetical protein